MEDLAASFGVRARSAKGEQSAFSFLISNPPSGPEKTSSPVVAAVAEADAPRGRVNGVGGN